MIVISDTTTPLNLARVNQNELRTLAHFWIRDDTFRKVLKLANENNS